MDAEILTRLQELGADTSLVDNDASLVDQLGSIRFRQVLFHDSWECYGIREFLEQHEDLYKSDQEAFVEELLDSLLADDDEPRGQMFWRHVLFTPLTPGSDDHKEWDDYFDELELTEIREVAGNGNLEFIQIIESYGYPDHYYICLSDPNPENPTVFGTDHEEYFSEITNLGTLKEFLDTLLSRSALREISLEYLADSNED
ncbi:MAG: hypothetical protein R3C01_07070 [Planctomycetaceae bacterium]